MPNHRMASTPFKSSRTALNTQMRKQLSMIDESSQESIEERKILDDMRMISEIRKKGKLIFRKQSTGPPPSKDQFVFSIFEWKEALHILIDEVKISAREFSRSIARNSNGWTRLPSTTHVLAETYIYDSNAKAETKTVFGSKFAAEITEFIEENLKVDYEQGDC